MTDQNDNRAVNQTIPRTTRAGQRTFLFLSSCPEPWGGSEELWSNAAKRLACAGHRVHVIKTLVDFEHKRIKELTDVGITIEDYCKVPGGKGREVVRRAIPRRWSSRLPDPVYLHQVKTINRLRPDLSVISQGANFDGLKYVEICQHLNVPYVLISQKASDQDWPYDGVRKAMYCAYSESRYNYFVSEHNRNLTELQIGARLPHAEVVRNPFLTPVAAPLPWPEMSDGRLRLACVARMFVQEKGQDILLNILAQDKWKARPLAVTFYGKGIHSQALEDMAALLGIRNVHFAGFTWDVTEIWRTHHGLVLPSRCEGLPLSLVEAMLCGRPAIVTNVGGNTEVIEDEETGFVATGASVYEFDAALERAWQRRAEWKAIGLLAATRIRTRIPEDPGGLFTAKLLRLCEQR
jgi:glycosyltransferase involved in cell wall biosynthesis